MYSKVSDFITSGMRVALIAAASIFLAACNDDASAPSVPSGGGDSPTPPVASTAGYVVDAPVTGAICNLYAITDGVAGTTVLAADTSNAGALDFGAVDHTGAAFVDCSGGTFTDEATGETKSAPDMSAVIDMTPGETYVVSLLTEIATRLAEATGDLGTALTEHNAAVADNFGLDSTDITTQVPTDLNAEAAQDDEAGHYGTVIALLSQMVEDGTAGETRDEVLTAITSDLEDDGKMSADSATAMDQAMTNFAEGDSAAKANMDTEVATAVTQSSGAGVRPVAAAGDDQSVAAGASVNLTGAGTDEDGTIASYAWELTTGSGVDLTNADAAEASFTAPSAAAASTLVFTLTVTDNDGNQHTDTVTISVAAAAAGQNITPVANAGDDQSVAAGASVTVTGTGTDQDGSIATYAWEEVSSSGVTLSGADSATLTFTAPSAASASTLEFKLTVTDNDGATASDNVKVDVAAQVAVDATAPAFTSSGSATIAENAPISTTVYDANATDAGAAADVGITYTLGGADAGSFSIVAASGVVTLKESADFETKSSYAITVTATDASNNSADKAVTITVTDVDDTDPVFTSATTGNFAENGTGTAYTAVATDASAVTYSLTGGADQADFNITSAGVMTFAVTPDFESPADSDGDNAYVVEITATDASSNTAVRTVTITVTNVDDTDPVFTSATTGNFAENGTGTAYTAVATDASAVTYSLTGGADQADFNITSAGVMTFAVTPDFESPADSDGDNAYVVEITATDASSNTAVRTVTITVTNVDDTDPVFTSATTGNFAENGTGTAYTAVATDASAVTYSLTGGADQADFNITSAGVMTFAVTPDFESPADSDGDNAYVVEITATDASSNTAVRTVTITVTNVDDTDPVFTSATTGNFAENGTGTAYTAVATDASAVTYSLTGGADQADFNITSAGVMTFAVTPDFESPADSDGDNAYVVEITATDASSNTAVRTVTITVTNVDDTDPVFTSATTGNFAENGTGTAYTAVATDASAVTYSLTGGADQADFNITSAGVMTFAVTPDFESPADSDGDNAYVVEITATDASSNTAVRTVTITVTNVDDTDPVFTSATTGNFAENGTGTAYTAVATDASAVTYSLTGGADQADFNITSAGVMTFAVTPDFESPADSDGDNAYVVEITATDASSNTAVRTVTITVTNVDEIAVASVIPTAGPTIVSSDGSPAEPSGDFGSTLGNAVAGLTTTINGSGFEASGANSKVDFIRVSDSTTVATVTGANVTSWVDGAIVLTVPAIALQSSGVNEVYTVKVTAHSGAASSETSNFTIVDCDTCRLNNNCPF